MYNADSRWKSRMHNIFKTKRSRVYLFLFCSKMCFCQCLRYIYEKAIKSSTYLVNYSWWTLSTLRVCWMQQGPKHLESFNNFDIFIDCVYYHNHDMSTPSHLCRKDYLKLWHKCVHFVKKPKAASEQKKNRMSSLYN